MATYTLTQYEAISAAIASGHTRVTYDGKTVEYRSLEEMVRIRNLIAAELGIGLQPCQMRVTPSFSKGIK